MSAPAPSKSTGSSAAVRPPVLLILSGALNPSHCMHLQCLCEVKAYLERDHGFSVIAGYLCPSSDDYLLKKLGHWAMSFEHRAALAAMISQEAKPCVNQSNAAASFAPVSAAGAGVTAKAMTPLQAALAKKAGHSTAASPAAASTSAASSSSSPSSSVVSSSLSSPDYSWLHLFPRGEFDSHKVVKSLLALPEYSPKRLPGLRVYEVFGADFVLKTKIYLRDKRFFVCVPREGSSEQLASQLAALDQKKRAALDQSKSFLQLPAVVHSSADLSSTKIRAALDSPDQAVWQRLVSAGWITQAALDYMSAHWAQLWIVPRDK